jgi:hypothetical protein
MPGDRTSLSLDARLVISTRVLCFEVSRRHRRTPIGPVLPTVQTGLTHRSDQSSDAALRSSSLALWINQGTQWFSGEPLETPRTRCSLHQSPLMTWLPRSPGSTLVLRLNQGTIHDSSYYSSHHAARTYSAGHRVLKPTPLVCSTPGGLTSIDLSRLFFTCTCTNQAATCTCNT